MMRSLPLLPIRHLPPAASSLIRKVSW